LRRNEKLAETFSRAQMELAAPHLWGSRKKVHRLMHAAIFWLASRDLAAFAEAMMRKLPVILECNAWTLPQERYNTEWVRKSESASCCGISGKSSAA